MLCFGTSVAITLSKLLLILVNTLSNKLIQRHRVIDIATLMSTRRLAETSDNNFTAQKTLHGDDEGTHQSIDVSFKIRQAAI
jgi:hypothetical protein